MKITLVGTGTGVPSTNRNSPCLLVRWQDKSAIFDSGPGILKNLLRFGVDFLNLDYIFYTHLHLDHISEFATILFAAKIPPTIRTKPLTVFGPSGLVTYYKKLKELYGETLSTEAYKLELREVGEGQDININGFTISTSTLEHHHGGMGYRVATPGNNIMVYSGDTDYCRNIIELAKDADLLLLECSFPDEMKMKGHLTPSLAGKIASQARVKKLVFMHMYPVCDGYDLATCCTKEFGGEVVVGEDSMNFELD